jgi:hypothetical protein
MPTVISVAWEGAAWVVRCPDLFDNAMVHRSGARAEAAARGLAERLSDSGLDCLLDLRLRDGALAGRFLCPARAKAELALPRAA